MAIKALRSKRFRLIIAVLLIFVTNIFLDFHYPKSFPERFNSLAQLYQTDAFVRNYIASKEKGSVLFIGGSSMAASLSLKQLNHIAKMKEIDGFKAQGLYLSARTIKSQTLFIKNFLNDGQIRFLVVDSQRMNSSENFPNFHDATLQSFDEKLPFDSSLLIHKFLAKLLVSLNSLLTRVFAIDADIENRFGKVEIENFGQNERDASFKDSSTAPPDRDIFWTPEDKSGPDPQSLGAKELKDFFSECSARNIIPILFISNRISKANHGSVIAKYWVNYSNFPIIYTTPAILEKKLNINYESLFEDVAHFSALGREKYTNLFAPAFLEFVYKTNTSEYRWWNDQ